MSSIELNSFSSTFPLLRAIRQGEVAKVEALLKDGISLKPNRYTAEITPLQLAAKRGQIEIVRLLIQFGEDIKVGNCCEGRHSPPLALASEFGHEEVVRYLVDQGANVNGEKETYPIPIHGAARKCNFSMIQLLVSLGANVNTRDPRNGNTLLHELVLTEGHKETLMYLFSQGADIDALNTDGKTPRQIAQEKGNRSFLDAYREAVLPIIRDKFNLQLGRDVAGLIFSWV